MSAVSPLHQQGSWRLEPLTLPRGMAVEWAGEGGVLLSLGNSLYRAPSPEGPRTLIGSVPAPFIRRAVSSLRLGQRLLRSMFYNAVPLPSGDIFVTFGRDVGVFRDGAYLPVEGIERPSRVLRRGCAVDAGGTVYWGEYLGNPERSGVSIYRLEAGSTRAVKAHTFEPGRVRHVHGVYADPADGSLWVATGDLEAECAIMRSTDGCATFETVGSGDETWRAVSLLFTPEAIYYGMDAEFRQNHVFRIDRMSRERTRVGDVGGPVYYSHKSGRDLFFAVTAEICPSQAEPTAALWHLPADGGALECVASFTKDIFRSRKGAALFMPGTLHFPYTPHGESSGAGDYVSGVGLAGADGRVFRLAASGVTQP